jgi:hypothetical protein
MLDAGFVVSDPSTWDEIRHQFPDQWVVLVALDWTDDSGAPVRTAFVAGHGTRKEALATARPLLAIFDHLGCIHTSSARVPVRAPIVYTSTPAFAL